MAFLLGLLPSVLTGSILFYWQRSQRKRDEEVAARAAARKRESLLGLQMQQATMKAALAAAICVRDNKVNGELKDAIASCEVSKQEYYRFMNEQAKEHILERVS